MNASKVGRSPPFATSLVILAWLLDLASQIKQQLLSAPADPFPVISSRDGPTVRPVADQNPDECCARSDERSRDRQPREPPPGTAAELYIEPSGSVGMARAT